MIGEFDDWARSATPSLIRRAYLLTGRQVDAEDLAQEVLERTAMSWSRIATSPDAFARTVLYRVHARSYRRRRIRETIGLDRVKPASADESPRVDRRLSLLAALAGLPPGQRAVIVLRYFEDLSEQDAALAMNCSVGTVKSQTSRALATLRESSPDLIALIGDTNA